MNLSSASVKSATKGWLQGRSAVVLILAVGTTAAIIYLAKKLWSTDQIQSSATSGQAAWMTESRKKVGGEESYYEQPTGSETEEAPLEDNYHEADGDDVTEDMLKMVPQTFPAAGKAPPGRPLLVPIPMPAGLEGSSPIASAEPSTQRTHDGQPPRMQAHRTPQPAEYFTQQIAQAQTEQEVQAILEQVIRQYTPVYGTNVDLIVAVIKTLFDDIPNSDQIEQKFKIVIQLMSSYHGKGVPDPLTWIRNVGGPTAEYTVKYINNTLTTAARLLFAHRGTQQ